MLEILGCVFVAAGLGLYLLLGPITRRVGGSRLAALSGKERIEAESLIRQTLIHAAGGIFLAGTLAASAIAAKQSFETLEAQRDAQVTDRYTKAVDQLGNKKKSVRAAAIFALGRITEDSPRDRETIMMALSSFIRDGAKRPDAKTEAELQESDEPEADINAAIAVLGRRDDEGYAQRLKLEEVYLPNAKLYALHLPRTLFNRANLAGIRARGTDTNLRNVDFSQAILVCADLRWADISSSEPRGDELSKRTNMRYADLRGAKLSDTKLQGALMKGANLDYAHLEGADLSHAKDLESEQLSRAFTDDKTKLPKGIKVEGRYKGPDYECWS
ncbi:pentapeptide repeat-containing protein [Streptomyces yangpuensis]|uniref:pentapeptide repeat-containing protein n=1 Tax=Streptomyces yangpuensis TaxID=1648182 RepID=UPI0014289579|nr:pentapeptide repeat-containing protein [Streptomyces yangpuensis]